MDKKNFTIGALLVIGALASFYFSARLAPPPSLKPPAEQMVPGSSPAGTPAGAPTPAIPGQVPAATAMASSPAVAGTPAEYVTLANEFVEIRFTNRGGAIDRVGLKKYRAGQNQPALYTLNTIQAAPALSLTDFPGADQHTAYALLSQTASEVVYRAVADGLEITRRYSLARAANEDDYQIRHETTFRNLTDKTLPLPRAVFNVGTAAPLNTRDFGQYLNAGYSDDKDASFINRSELEGGGLLAMVGAKDGTPPLYIQRSTAVAWATVKNQFFAMILTPDQPGTGMRVERVKLFPLAPDTDRNAYGITGYVQFELKPLAAGAASTFGASYFVGPKEYKRLSNGDIFKHGEAKIMQFDTSFYYKIFFTGFVAPLLLTMMTWVHSIVPNWGWAIVITTLILKIVFLPATLAASRSAKRMAKLNPHMQAMREKYKDNPQKIQTETLRMFKENKVNPLGGCLPILITIPFFIGFFSMLQSASELRFASFLWAHDLSAPDTVAHVFGFPLNIMPILMGATTIIQMRLTPTPTTDNAQATMMKIMPWMMMIFFYNFAAGLALYSTINGLFTIGQQLVINRMPEPHLPGVHAADGLKNVTPPKKKK
jgi:YidC/Oxa1 family membrane protein insertase